MVVERESAADQDEEGEGEGKRDGEKVELQEKDEERPAGKGGEELEQSLGVPKEHADGDESGSAVSTESVGTQLARKMRELTL